jgi:hypothetical protein
MKTYPGITEIEKSVNSLSTKLEKEGYKTFIYVEKNNSTAYHSYVQLSVSKYDRELTVEFIANGYPQARKYQISTSDGMIEAKKEFYERLNDVFEESKELDTEEKKQTISERTTAKFLPDEQFKIDEEKKRKELRVGDHVEISCSIHTETPTTTYYHDLESCQGILDEVIKAYIINNGHDNLRKEIKRLTDRYTHEWREKTLDQWNIK